MRKGLITALLGISLLWTGASAEAVEDGVELIHLSQYKPIYFLVGNPYVKVELSFKAQLVKKIPIFFGYSQLMFWDIFIPSPAFHDLNYNPDFFYRLGLDEDPEAQPLNWIDFSPLEHESDGFGGTRERSWNRSYARLHRQVRIGETAKLISDIKIGVPWGIHVNNPDLLRYRGLWELTLTWSDFWAPFLAVGDLTLRLYPGGDSHLNPTQGGQEVTFSSKTSIKYLLPKFVVQVFHGYGENLLDYQTERWGLRLGVGF